MIEDIEPQIQEEIVQDVPESIPEPLSEKPLSLRETIEKARIDIDKSNEEKPQKKAKNPREHDESGRFKKKEEKVENVSHETELTQKAPEIKFHQALGDSIKSVWKDLPANVQSILAKRGEEIHQGLTKMDDERSFGKQIRQVIAPYEAMIRAEGGTPDKAIQELLNTAYLLRTATPQQKGQLIRQVAQQFGADMSGTQQGQQAVHPMLQQALQKVETLESKIAKQEALRKQTEDSEIQRQIGSFAADPKNVNFETVKAHMASLLQSGLAKDLQEAYDQAVYANPHTRSTLLEEQKLQSNEKRVAEQKARAEAARKAGSSIKGSPGLVASANGKIVQPDLRSELRAQFAAHRES